MTKLRLKSNNQLSLPASITKELRLAPGDELLAEIRDGQLIIIPAELVPRDEAYLFTPWWQQAIAEAEAEFANGKVERFDSFSEAFEKLRKTDAG
jgi:AbrB family looped-hinge helix DNA binding protein